MKKPEKILEEYADGLIDKETAVRELYESRSGHLLHTRIDHDREFRTGAPEVVYGEGKTPGQIVEIVRHLVDSSGRALATRLSDEAMEVLVREWPEASCHSAARLVSIGQKPPVSKGFVAVVSAGTSDQPVADEAALTAEFLGSRVKRFYDCGVAGLHRILDVLDEVREARVIVAVAGMEGALPSVLAGLVKVPVIAVPTSVGYGMNLQGVSTLLAMLNSCANGVSVVNVDNGFGAGYNAHIINAMC